MKKSYWGKAIGGVFGFMAGGPVGAVLGIWIGHNFDRGLLSQNFRSNNTQKIFFDTTFLMMGHIAKTNGRVSEKEILLAKEVMNELGLNIDQKQSAMELFTQGKQTDFDFDTTLQNFRHACPFHPGLTRTFMEIQIKAAYADGFASTLMKQRLQYIANALHLGVLNFNYYDFLFGKQAGFQSENQYRYDQRAYTYHSTKNTLDGAYNLLGIKKEAQTAEIKKAYRRLMNQHHPDKLISKGLPEEMMKVATEKTQKIKEAYEQIRAAKGFK